ncbi:MAG: hypothetical protein IPO22_13425 [Anaerolineales bacterium]|nr:hypothetical protein [Anaerolineales bacterium]
MNTTLNKIASVLAFLVGGLSIFAGALAMTGWEPGYFVLNWLPCLQFHLGHVDSSHPRHPHLEK